jgi:CheY-like chemotaxis protein
MSGEKQRILIVDDTPANIQILNETLKDDYDIYFAMNGKDALQNAQTVIPDLVLLDIMMPGMDGYEVCSALKKNSSLKDIPVIFITALNQEDHETKGLGLGAVDYIAKPFNPTIVRLRVNNHMELKRHRDALALRNEELREALSKIKTLSGLLPICASCKKIRDDKGYWSQIEAYVSRHTEAEFSHSICPDCAKKLYPDFYDEMYSEKKESARTLRVLLAEDNAINQEVTRRQLQGLGYTVDAAADGVEVLEVLQGTVYDVILMDCQMPEMDGWEATRVIRRRERDSRRKPVYIIAMTADGAQEARDKCLAAGMDDCLTKPVQEDELRKALECCRQTENVGSSEGGMGCHQPELDQVTAADRVSVSEEVPCAAMEDRPVDMERLEEISGGNPGRLHELVGLYLLQADELIGGARTATKAGAATEVARLVHKLAGSSSTCGMKAIVPPLQELERRAKQGQLCGADQLLDEAKQKLGSIRSLIVDRSPPSAKGSRERGHEKNPDH